jgi:hypothetical protein
MAKTKTRQTKQKDVSIWDRFWIFVKANEKVFWVILLVLISFSFAFTGAVDSMLRSSGSGLPVVEVNGETLYQNDRMQVNYDVGRVMELRGDAIGLYQHAGLLNEVTEYLEGWGNFQYGSTIDDLVYYHLYLDAADERGIYVSDAELGTEVRFLFAAFQARSDAATTSIAQASGQLDREVLKRRMTALLGVRAFEFKLWAELLRQRGIQSPQEFEAALRKYKRIEKLIGYIQQSVAVARDDVYTRFLREEQLRKVSFFEIKPDESVRAEVAASLTDADLEEYYESHAETFQVTYGAKLRAGYVYIPYEHFADGPEPTDEDLQAHYLESRDAEYRRDLNVDTTEFSLLSEEEKAQRDERLYVPLEEVRGEVAESWKEAEANERAVEFAAQVKSRVFPSDAEEEPTAPAALAEEFPFVEVGKTPFMTSWEAEDKAGKVNSSGLAALFSTLMSNARETDPSKHRPVAPTRQEVETNDGSGLVLYTAIDVLQPGEETFAKLVDDVREAAVKDRALDRIEEKVEALVASIRAGEKPFEAAAEEYGARVHTSPYQKKTSPVYLPVEKDAEDAEESAPAEDTGPRTEFFAPGSKVMARAFAIEEEGAVGDPVRDAGEGAYYVVRLEGSLEPAPEDFTEEQENRHRAVLANDRQNYYLQNWRRQLWQKAQVKAFRASAEV